MNQIWIRLKCDNDDPECPDGFVLNKDGDSCLPCPNCDGRGYIEKWITIIDLLRLLKEDIKFEQWLVEIFPPNVSRKELS